MTIQFTPPRDAEGREIPRGTNVMYDINGKKLHITKFIYQCDAFGLWSQWKVFSSDIKSEDDGMLPTESLYLTQPDSWEKLEEDLDRGIKGARACAYICKDGVCQNCVVREDQSFDYPSMILKNVKRRIHNLRSEN